MSVSRHLLTLLLTSVVTCTPLYADDDLYSMSIEELLQVKVKVSTGNERTRSNTPSSITVFTSEDLEGIEQQVRHEIESGVQFARESAFPDPSEVAKHVYAD